MKKFLTCTAAAMSMALLAAGAASAQSYPANISGTWNIRANDTTVFTFTVTSQSSDAPCALINGVISPSDILVGYYCPATGSVSFLRNSANTGATFQVYTGQVSWVGTNTYMAGNFSNYAGGNNTGEYGFTASISGL